MDIPRKDIELAFYSERQSVAFNTELARPDGGTAGLYSEQDGKTIIGLEVSQLADPTAVVATFAHELCHVHLLGGARLSRDEEDIEPLTDLATVVWGMGIFTANAMLRDKSWRVANWEAWSISRQGYLTAPILGYALGLFAWLRQETRPEWADYLRRDVRSYFRKALAYFVETKDALSLPPESCDDRPPACPAELLPRSTGHRQGSAGSDEIGSGTAEDEVEDCATADGSFTRATIHMQNGQPEEALHWLSNVILHDNKDGEAYQQRALAYISLSKWSEALADAEESVRLLPDESESYRARGMAYLYCKQYAAAIRDFSRYLSEEDAMGSNPARPGAVYYFRGLAYEGEGNLRRALADFTKAIRRWPQWSTPYEARGRVYERLGETAKARVDRDEAVRRGKVQEVCEPSSVNWTPVVDP